MSEALAAARSFLFVPGNRPERFEKAVESGADAVVFDLEDAVPPAEKSAARAAIEAAWNGLRARGIPLVVRINAVATEAGRGDLEWLSGLSRPAGVMVPKAEAGEALEEVAVRLGVPILPLIETAAGYASLAGVAGTQGVLRLVVGHIDFIVDTGIQISEGEPELHSLRFGVAVATSLHRLAPAVDGVTVAIHDDQRLRDDTHRALRYGCGAKLCIHPRQVPIVHEALAPSPDELEWARRVVEADAASQGSALQLDGRMVDRPVVVHARRTLARANR